MTHIRLGRLWLAAAVLAATIPTSPLQANEEIIGYKDMLCKLVGCSTGERKCAEIRGEVKDPVSGSNLSVTWTCYEGEKVWRGGGASYDAAE